MAQDSSERSEFDRILEMREKMFADSVKNAKRKRKSFKKNRYRIGPYPWENLTAAEESVYARIHHCKTQHTVVPTPVELAKPLLPFYPKPRRRFCLVYDHMNVPSTSIETDDPNKLRLLNILKSGNGEGRIGERKQVIDWSLFNSASTSPVESVQSTPAAKRARRDSTLTSNNKQNKVTLLPEVKDSISIRIKLEHKVKEEPEEVEENSSASNTQLEVVKQPPLSECNLDLHHDHNTRSKKRYWLKLFEGTREVPPMYSEPSTKENSVGSSSSKSESVTEEIIEDELAEDNFQPEIKLEAEMEEVKDSTLLSDSDPLMQSFLDAAIRDLDLERIMPLEIDVSGPSKIFQYDHEGTPVRIDSTERSLEDKCQYDDMESPGTKRGRPRKYKPGEELVKLGISTGRPRGRPRKYEHGYEEEYRRRAERPDDEKNEPSTSYACYASQESATPSRNFLRKSNLNGHSKPKKSTSQMPQAIANFGIMDEEEYPTPPCSSKETQNMCKEFEGLYENVPTYLREAFHNELLSYARNIMPNFAADRSTQDSEESEVEESDNENKNEELLSEATSSQNALGTEDSSPSSISSTSEVTVKEEAVAEIPKEELDNENLEEQSISGESHISLFTSGDSDEEQERAKEEIEDDEDYFFDEEPLFEKFKRKHGYQDHPSTSSAESPTPNSEGGEEINVEDFDDDNADEFVSPYKPMERDPRSSTPIESSTIIDSGMEYSDEASNPLSTSKRILFPCPEFGEDPIPSTFCSDINSSIPQRIPVKADSH